MANDSCQIFTIIRPQTRCNDYTPDILMFASTSGDGWIHARHIPHNRYDRQVMDL